MAQENISAQLTDLLASRDFQPELLDKEGRPTDAENADIFTFDFVSSSGKNYGTMVVILDTDNEMQVFYGDNLGRSMEGDDKTEFFDFVQHLHKFANMRRWTYSPKNINQVKYTMQGLAAIKEGLFEGYYGTRKISYSGEPTEARLVIQHNRVLGEEDARFRYVDSLFIETADSERYRLQFKNLAGGRAMLEHVRQGGRPYDVRGSHITEMVSEIATLSRFNRASAGRVLEGVTAELVTEAQQYYRSLRENLKRMAHTRGYQTYFESWHPAETTLQEELVDSIKTMFVEQTLDSRIEAALPVLARLQQENRMKEADIFESWADHLTEGTWQLPETPEQQSKLQELMSRELIVGPDATNATQQLDDLVGDDVLFDRLEELAARDASANVWDDSEIQARLAELGIQLPAAEPVVDPAAQQPVVDPAAQPEQQPPVQESRVKELSMDLEDPLMSDSEFETKYGDSRENMQGRAGQVQDRRTGRFYNPDQEFDRLRNSPEFGAQMRRMAQQDGVAEGSDHSLKKVWDRYSKHLMASRGDHPDVTQINKSGEITRNIRKYVKDHHGQKAVDDMERYAEKQQFAEGVAEGTGETPQQQKVRAAISNGLARSSQMGKAEYQSQPTNRTYFDNAGYASDKLTGVDSIDSDGTVVISIGDTRAADWVKKLATLGGMPGIKTREVQPKSAQGVAETALRDKADLVAKRRALQDLSRNPGVDQRAVQQRQQDLEKEARSKDLAESLLDEFAEDLDSDDAVKTHKGGIVTKTAHGIKHTKTNYQDGTPGEPGVKSSGKQSRYKQTPILDKDDDLDEYQTNESSGCNATMEGEMCPEHGLAECGMHESQVQESQQHDADLARLKSLAHGR